MLACFLKDMQSLRFSSAKVHYSLKAFSATQVPQIMINFKYE